MQRGNPPRGHLSSSDIDKVHEIIQVLSSTIAAQPNTGNSELLSPTTEPTQVGSTHTSECRDRFVGERQPRERSSRTGFRGSRDELPGPSSIQQSSVAASEEQQLQALRGPRGMYNN